MSQPALLEIPNEWEKIVNNVERHNARARFEANLYQRKLKKKVSKVAELGLGAILSVGLGAAGLLAPWLAGAVAIVFVCAACFHGGRLWEGFHKGESLNTRE
ncbi:MAG: hypothetical protein IJX01_07530 [Oscillospiraceae bacterium]|nr:hypothetical protein [Oscillospiraceae bacterium]